MANMSDRFKQLMDELGLKQRDVLALATPICKGYGITLTKQHISNYANGVCLPDLPKALALSKALNVPAEYLLGYTDSRNEELSPFEHSALNLFRCVNTEDQHLVLNMLRGAIEAKSNEV